jgi:L-ascorbate metabolism protein UlaG (beta-lactamase superfamily)
MKKIISLSIILLLIACKNDTKPNSEDTNPKAEVVENKAEMPLELTPIQHATFVMEWGNEVIYVDPTGGEESFADLMDPSLVFITDIHGDHFNVETLNAIPQTFDIIAPKAVYDKMPENLQTKTKVIANGESFDYHGFDIKAIPMYNQTEGRLKFHEKGRGNGYVISRKDYKVYISGDTEDIPEMRMLTDINLAFICMNLPYTMTPVAAADATLEFKPKKVIPYHYRGSKDGETHYFSVENFKEIVNTGNSEIEVELLDWYPSK